MSRHGYKKMKIICQSQKICRLLHEVPDKDPWKQMKFTKQSKYCFDWFKPKASRISKPKSILNSKEISKTLNIAKLSTFIEEDGTNWVKGRLQHSNFDCNSKQPILLTGKHPVVQFLLERAHSDNLHEGTEYVRNILKQEYWISGLTCVRKNQIEMYQMQTQEGQPYPSTDGRFTTWWTWVPIHPYLRWLRWAVWNQIPTTYIEEVVLLLVSNYKSSKQRSYTVIGYSHV